MDINLLIQQATGQAWEQFRTEHPAQAMDIELEFGVGEVIVGLNRELAKDQRYLDLVAKTDAETSIAELIEALLPIVADVAMKMLL